MCSSTVADPDREFISCSGYLLHALMALLFLAGAGTVQAVSTVPNTCVLPAYGNWNSAVTPEGYGPPRQLEWIREGHRISPWFSMPLPTQTLPLSHYEDALREYRARKLPLTFISTQWEYLLSEQPFLRIRDDSNPNVLGTRAANEKRLSPFGSEEYWYETGKRWTGRELFRQLAAIYPDPPKVVFLSNNEHPVLGWNELQRDRRFAKRYSGNLSDEEKREITAKLWEKLYQSLHKGMRDGLADTPWKDKIKLVGFLANGNMNMGRDSGWPLERVFTRERIDPYARFWDGSSFDIYYNSEETLLRASPLRAMNSVFMVEENRRLRRDYLTELSIWDGHTYNRDDWRSRQEKISPGSSLPAYVALGTLGMWLLKPEVVREFRFYDESYTGNHDYTLAIMERIDAVSSDAVLRSFWCDGELVRNTKVLHPYQYAVPAQYRTVSRWYFLDVEPASVSPTRAGANHFAAAIALRKGRAPERSWLVYGYSAGAPQTNARLNVPEFGTVDVKLDADGSYYLLREKDRYVQLLHPASAVEVK